MSNPDTVTNDNSAVKLEDWSEGISPAATFMIDAMHFPTPLSPLTLDIYTSAWVEGANQGMHEVGIPVRRWHVIARNNYRFDWQEMEESFDETAVAESLGREMNALMDRWQNDHLPSITSDFARLDEVTGQVASADDVGRLVDLALETFADLWRIHFLIVSPMGLAMQLFDDFYADLFGGAGENGHPLLAGRVNESIKAGFGLSDLAVRARELGLADTIVDHEPGVALADLAGSDAGREFLADLYTYLETYGLRQALFDVAAPTWRERPEFALTYIRNYLVSGVDARVHHAEVVNAAEEAKEQARAAIAQYPEPVRQQFEALLALATDASFLQEEHNHYIDQIALARLRLFFLAVGQRLVEAGVIDAPEDVFYVTIGQIKASFDQQVPLQDRVRSQRRSFELAHTITPPPFLGSPPAGPPPTDSPFQRSVVRFFGAPPPQVSDPGVVQGNPGARGQASGPARVVRTLEEASALQPGEILVTMTTMPPWSPLFAIAAGVVTETGGPLSHCAIVAREYDIPAVVGAAGAMQRIRNGQVISIDGVSGTVTLQS